MSPPRRGRATLRAHRLSCDLAGRPVLRDISLVLDADTRLGVVGPNGAGKSTLLGLLAGERRADHGSVTVDPPTATVGLLAQEPDGEDDETVRDLLARRTGVRAAEVELAAAAEALGGGGGSEARYADALERLTALAGGDIDGRIDRALRELGLAPAVAARPAASLSGGELARISLAAIVLSRFDVTLLDEPTNSLDFDGLARLQDVLAQRAGPVVVVSHDRAFLDRTVTAVLELDDHDHRARHYDGGWQAYLAERATARRHAEEAFRDSTARRQALRQRAQRERQWATSGVHRERRHPTDGDKAQRDFRLNRTERLAQRARRTERALAALPPVDKPYEGWELRFHIARAPRSGAVVAGLSGAIVRRGDFCLGPMDLEIEWGERVNLAGRNGAGKSTLVGALLGTVDLSAGTRWIGPSVVVGVLGQNRRGPGTRDLLSATMAHTGANESETRSLLAKFGLGPDDVTRPTTTVSPGERTRAELAAFQGRGVNFLVLDEPTNHLDLPAIEQLEVALEGYEGTLLVVSHDRALLAQLSLTRRIDLADGQVRPAHLGTDAPPSAASAPEGS